MAAAQQGFEQALDLAAVFFKPGRRKLAQDPVEDLGGKVHDSLQPGLKVIEGAHIFVNDAPRIQAGNAGIGKIPMRTVKSESVIDHQGDEAEFAGRNSRARQPVLQLSAEKDGLPSVRIGYPAVEGEDSEELLGIRDLVEEGIRNKVVDRHVFGIAGITRAEVPARRNGLAARARLQMYFGIGGDEFGGQADDSMPGRCDLQMGQNPGRHEFIHEDPAMLRVILKLDDVIVAVVGFQQMRLCAASHLPDESARVYGHIVSRSPKSQRIAPGRGSIN